MALANVITFAISLSQTRARAASAAAPNLGSHAPTMWRRNATHRAFKMAIARCEYGKVAVGIELAVLECFAVCMFDFGLLAISRWDLQVPCFFVELVACLVKVAAACLPVLARCNDIRSDVARLCLGAEHSGLGRSIN